MINFRQKKFIIKDLRQEAIDHLKGHGLRPNLIDQQNASDVSKVNSKAMVLLSFIQNEKGYFEIKLQDKELYNYTQKLIKDIFKMRITDIDKENRILTAETDFIGKALDAIEILERKYNLSIVQV